MKVVLNSTQRKKRRNQISSFLKESVENEDLCKPVLNKIMTTQE